MVLLLLGVCITLNANDLTKSVQGVWTVRVVGAPYGYQDYQVTVKQVEGKSFADVKSSALNLKDQALKEVDGKLTTTVDVGESVHVVIWKEKGRIKGTADTSMGKLPIEFSRPEVK
ncbi:MAG TPA: hypothetical protein DDW85_05645 [Porphyromonadaceae bacterium]|nr:hypothetical protein [Porphyromonadaceae bacterium]